MYYIGILLYGEKKRACRFKSLSGCTMGRGRRKKLSIFFVSRQDLDKRVKRSVFAHSLL